MKNCLFALIITLAALAGVCRAEIINVPDDFATIQAGIDTAQDGDTVLIAPGEYKENLRWGAHNITLASLYVTTNDTAYVDSTIIDGGANGHRVIDIQNQEVEEATIIGLTIRNGLADENGDQAAAGIFIHWSAISLDHLIVVGNEAVSGYGGGIMCLGSPHFQMSNSRIIGNSAGLGGGGLDIYSGVDAQIHDCVIMQNKCKTTGAGIRCEENCSLEMSRIVLCDNEVENAPGSAGSIYLGAGTVANLNGCTITNNIGREFGIEVVYSSLSIDGSVLWQNGDYEVLLNNSTGEISYCDVTRGELGIDGDGMIYGDGNIDSDPLFADPDNGDYHLTAESPCIDAGDPESDLDPDGTRADMGAFYFHQRDIEVSPTEIHFPAIPFGETDSALVLIKNVGLTNLHITDISLPLYPSTIGVTPAGEFDPPVEVAPDSSMVLWLIFAPSVVNGINYIEFMIDSDDPDEPSVRMWADGQVEGIDDEDLGAPYSFGITAIHPNPFNQSSVVSYQLSVGGWAKLALYDGSGRLVQTVVNEEQAAGEHRAVIGGGGPAGTPVLPMPSGVYLLSLREVGGKQSVAKVVLLR